MPQRRDACNLPICDSFAVECLVKSISSSHAPSPAVGAVAASPLASDRWIVVQDSLEDILSNRSRGVLPRKLNALWPKLELEKETGRVVATQSRTAIPVAWTFMSEIFTKHGRLIERGSRSNNHRFDLVLWPCDGHECPSYIRSFRHRTQKLDSSATRFEK